MDASKINVDTIKSQLKEIVSKDNGLLFESPADVKKILVSNNIDKKTASQISMIFECSHVINYIKKDTLSLIDVNNCLNDIIDSTGLNAIVCKDLLSAILYAYGLQPITEEFDKSHITELKRTGQDLELINPVSKSYEAELEIIDQYVENQHTTGLNEKAHILEQALRDGDAYALYIKGKCYLNGVGTAKDPARAKELLSKSSAKGFAKANTLLGDIALKNYSYTEAYNYYTGLGAVALSPERQKNLSSILRNKKINRKMLVGSGIILALTILFNLLLMTGVFCASGCTHYPSGVISILLSLAVFAIIVFYYIHKRYDSPRWFLLLGNALTAIFTFIALVI